MPTWTVFVIVVVLVVGYYLLSSAGKQRRIQKVSGAFTKIPNFHANQVYTDVLGESAIGIDDRGRRIAVARKHGQPHAQVYSFAHIVSAEILQGDTPIAGISRSDHEEAKPGEGGPAEGSLFGSTGRTAMAMPPVKPMRGPTTMLGVRVVLDGASDPVLLIRFYAGKAIDLESVGGEKALGEARVCLGALDVAVKRAALPARGRATPASG